VDEVLLTVDIALGHPGGATCAPPDSKITVDKILIAVNDAVGKCPVTTP